ncbi:MAG: SDR family oxidoreductase [Sphaerochaetaceae bacterium]
MESFKDKVCVVTGGAQGIGRCITREFATQGALVAFIDKERELGEEHQKTLPNRAFFYHGDIADEEVLRNFAAKVVALYGRVDYLINNAAINLGGIFTPCSYNDFNRVLKVGVSAPYLLTSLLLPHFNQGASIVNIGSTRAFMSQANTESYSAAKGAITALTHALAVSLAPKVRVNSVSPGWIETGEEGHSASDKQQHLSKRVGRPEDIARAVLFLCDAKNDFITGENLNVDGGMSKTMVYHGDGGWSFTPSRKL